MGLQQKVGSAPVGSKLHARVCVCARGHMPGAICPEAYALGHMPGAIGPGPYARGHVHGPKTITCAVYGGTGAKTSVCVAFGYSTVLVPFFRVRHARSNMTLAHIWRPERATRLPECMFISLSRMGTRIENIGARKHYAVAHSASGEDPAAL